MRRAGNTPFSLRGRYLALLALLLAAVSSSAVAQTVNGAFHGVIADSSGSVIPGAKVVLKNLTNQQVRQATTNEVGFYTITQLPPGHYSVTVSKAGFTTAYQSDVQLLVNQDLEANYSLAVGQLNQQVEVRVAPPMLKTSDSTLGQVVGSQQVVDLPLNGRQFTQLILLTPGAAPKESGQQAGFTIPIGGGGISPSVNGQRGQENNFTLDGVLNNAIFTNTWAISPPPDAIQEFNVQSHITNGEFSISSGANVNVVTKSGGNQFHGDAWEFLRNDAFDAANFFDNFANQTKPPFRMNQYGGTIGGPVMLPGYDGRKKKTYFFGYWEGFRSTQGFTLFNNVPTANELNGDFSDLLTNTQATGSNGAPLYDPLGRPIMNGQIYNPYSTRQVTAGQVDPVTGLIAQSSGFVRDPFAGNIVPSGMLNPQVLAYIHAFYPLPNYGPGGNSFPNYAIDSNQVITSNQYGVKVDHTFSNNDTLYGNFYYFQPLETSPNSLLLGSGITQNEARVVAVGYTHLFSPTLLGTFHYGYNWTDFGSTNQPGGTALLAATGTTGFEPVRDGIPEVPQISLAPRLGGTGQFAIPLGPIQSHELSADIQKISGSNTISAGLMLYRIHSFDDGWGSSIGFDQFPSSALFGSNSNAASTGDGLASALLNLPSSLFGFVGNTAANDTTLWQGYYIQDKWQASKKLSVQIGMRYDYVAPPTYKNNQVAGWNPNCPAAGNSLTAAQQAQVIQSCYLIPEPFVQPPTAANPNPPSWPFANVRKSYFDPKYNGWEPRFGFAYGLGPKTVLRGGFAVFDDHNNTLVQESQDPRIAWPFGAGISEGGLNRGVPSTFFNNLPPASSFLPPANSNPNIAFAAAPNLDIPYSMEYNFGIEQQVTPNTTATINYVGSESRHLFIQPMYNAPLPSQMGPGPVAPRTPFPFLGQFPYDTNSGVSNYNALEAKLEKRFADGLTFLASYTYSKCNDIQSEGQSGSIENPYNWSASYGPCDFNIPQLLSFSYTYQLPVGQGKHFVSSPSRALDALVGGWQISGITTAESGSPFTVTVPFDNANINPSSETQRGNVVPNASLLPSGFQQSVFQWYNPAAFAVPAPYTYGNAGRNSMRGPSYLDFDFALFKTFQLSESMALQFRAETFNIFNNVNLSPPGGGASGGFSTLGGASTTAVGAPGFMQIFSAAAAREVQFSLKFLF